MTVKVPSREFRARFKRLANMGTEGEVRNFLVSRDIRGIRERTDACPITQYLKRNLGDRVDVQTHGDVVEFFNVDTGHMIQFDIPIHLQVFIELFDENEWPELEMNFGEKLNLIDQVLSQLEQSPVDRGSTSQEDYGLVD